MAMIERSTMINRMVRAAKLEPNVYEEAEHTPSLQSEAITVVALVAVLSGVGTFLDQVGTVGIGNGLVGLIVGIIVSLIGFFIWAGIAYFIGTRVFGGTADYGELIRTLGYAYSPNALALLIFIPFLGSLLAFIGSIWALVAGVVAIRQALDFDTTKAILTVIVGWIVGIIAAVIIGVLLGIGAGIAAVL